MNTEFLLRKFYFRKNFLDKLYFNSVYFACYQEIRMDFRPEIHPIS